MYLNILFLETLNIPFLESGWITGKKSKWGGYLAPNYSYDAFIKVYKSKLEWERAIFLMTIWQVWKIKLN